MSDPSPSDSARFHRVPSIRHAVVFEALLLLVALGLGLIVAINPLSTVSVRADHIILGVTATVPPALALWFLERSRARTIVRLRRLVRHLIGPLLTGATRQEVIALAVMAGVAEEALFRGLLQEGLVPVFGWAPSLLLASVSFGLVHMITPFYALLAGVVGLYLGMLQLVTGNLLVPVMVHALYDIVALQYLMTGGQAVE